MTKRKDPDIMAIEHAIAAIKKSSPSMLKANIAFIIPILQRLAREAHP